MPNLDGLRPAPDAPHHLRSAGIVLTMPKEEDLFNAAMDWA